MTRCAKYISLHMLVLWVLLGGSEAGEFRQFTDRDGRTITARIIQYDVVGGRVELEMENRRRDWVSLEDLSPEDQAYVKEAMAPRPKPREKGENEAYSNLWGSEGELWSPQGRLPDFSYAGYHCGEKAIPQIEVVADVTDFGAVGDGKTDCTAAFTKAIESTYDGAIYIPPGRYVISDIIWIRKSHIVLRGAGPGKTIIYCTTELEDVRPNMGSTTRGKPTSRYSWSGGFLWVKGEINGYEMAPISQPAKRGTKKITLENELGILRPGQLVTIRLVDDENKSLLDEVYSGDPGETDKIKDPVTLQLTNRIISQNGKQIQLEWPLRLDINPSWSATLRTYAPNVKEVGIEELTIEFPEKPYAGHVFEERGMNGIAMNGVADCWIRNVQISNSDSGIYLAGEFCTLDGVVLDADRKEGGGTTGHHGITVGKNCLVQNFDFKTRFVHDISTSNYSHGNVVKNGRGINITLDHHKKGPFENLFCNIDAGEGTLLWKSGGGRALGRHCGARSTFWCIRSSRRIPKPPSGFAPDSINIVGVNGLSGSTEKEGSWIERIKPAHLYPADLHAAQLARRLASGASEETDSDSVAQRVENVF